MPTTHEMTLEEFESRFGEFAGGTCRVKMVGYDEFSVPVVSLSRSERKGQQCIDVATSDRLFVLFIAVTDDGPVIMDMGDGRVRLPGKYNDGIVFVPPPPTA